MGNLSIIQAASEKGIQTLAERKHTEKHITTSADSFDLTDGVSFFIIKRRNEKYGSKL